MPSRNESSMRPRQTTSELLDFYDELTALNACNAFVMQALTTALTNDSGLGEHSSTGAVFCAQWLNDRTVELEIRLKKLLSQVHSSAGTGPHPPGPAP